MMSDQEAIRRIAHEIGVNPNSVDHWLMLAHLLAEDGEEGKALQSYQRVLRLDPDNIEALENIERLQAKGASILETGEKWLAKIQRPHLSPLEEALVGIILFLAAVLLALLQNWQATELVWSLWVSSLVLGYAFLLTTIFGMIARGDRDITITDSVRLPGILAVLPKAVFMLVFFSVHFLLFHFVHSMFLNNFFPLWTRSPLNYPALGIFSYFFDLILEALKHFWPFVLISGIISLNSFLNAYHSSSDHQLFKPYINVVRMHLMIFVLAFMDITNISTFAMYVVLLFYFLPINAIRKLLSPAAKTNP